MKELISKELLSEIGYGKVISDIEPTDAYDMECIQFRTEVFEDSGRGDNTKVRIAEPFIISIDTIARKCKEWAWNNGEITLRSCYSGDKEENLCEVINMPKDFTNIYSNILSGVHTTQLFYGDTEPESIFQACEWILTNNQK